MVEKMRILVVEDDASLMLGLVENLRFEGYEVTGAENGLEGLDIAVREKPDLILLDVMLPGLTGYEVCRRIREQGIQTSIIMLTARKEEFDKVLGFDLGTDDYVTKPFSIKELLARVKAVLRRVQGARGGEPMHAFGDFELDIASRTLKRRGVEIPLTRTEFDLLAYLVGNKGKALSRELLMSDVWGSNYLGTQRSLDSFVSCLRKKIEKRPSDPQFILTVHGVGYKFEG